MQCSEGIQEDPVALLHKELDRLSKLPQNSRLKVIERALTLFQQQRTTDAQQVCLRRDFPPHQLNHITIYSPSYHLLDQRFPASGSYANCLLCVSCAGARGPSQLSLPLDFST
eukprot:5155970-Pyramimonas_sp.AAC.1